MQRFVAFLILTNTNSEPDNSCSFFRVLGTYYLSCSGSKSLTRSRDTNEWQMQQALNKPMKTTWTYLDSQACQLYIYIDTLHNAHMEYIYMIIHIGYISDVDILIVHMTLLYICIYIYTYIHIQPVTKDLYKHISLVANATHIPSGNLT